MQGSGAADAASAARVMAFCADMGGSFIKFGRATAPGAVVEEARIPTPAHDWDALCDGFAAWLDRVGAEALGAPLAISTAGLFDRASGIVSAANIPCLAGRDLPRALGARLGRRVLVANDADSFALAEAAVGAARGHEVVLAIILGTGLGGGLVVGGRLVQGAAGITGEWGHGAQVSPELLLPGETTPVRVPQIRCGCGQMACVETVGGARGIELLHRHLSGIGAGGPGSHEILDLWEAGDPGAGRTVALWTGLVSNALALALNVTGAAMVPVGGGLGGRPRLVAALDAAVRARILYKTAAPLLVPGEHLANGGLVGISVLAAGKAGE